MPNPTPDLTLSFSHAQDLATWLKQHHASETELWIKIYKKHTNMASVSWDDVVIESLCWGWIDGIKKPLDHQSYLQLITPRKSRSIWSKRNCNHAERLISEGRMQAAGMKHVEAAKADGRWDNAYSVSEMTVPEDFINALEAKPVAKQFYATLTKSSRYVIAHGLGSAKKAETRQRRFDKFMNLLAQKKKP